MTLSSRDKALQSQIDLAVAQTRTLHRPRISDEDWPDREKMMRGFARILLDYINERYYVVDRGTVSE